MAKKHVNIELGEQQDHGVFLDLNIKITSKQGIQTNAGLSEKLAGHNWVTLDNFSTFFDGTISVLVLWKWMYHDNFKHSTTVFGQEPF